MHLYLATGNRHKLKEFQAALPQFDIRIPQDYGYSFDCNENGDTFSANSLIKAKYLFDIVSEPVIADDSGLCIDALDGMPGIFSARYGAKPGMPDLSAEEKNKLVLSELKGKTNRKCSFVCCLTVILSKDRFFQVQENCPGTIIDNERGTNGFGYDPIVFLPEFDCTIAELSPEQKNEISHRGKAIKNLKAFLSLKDITKI